MVSNKYVKDKEVKDVQALEVARICTQLLNHFSYFTVDVLLLAPIVWEIKAHKETQVGYSE